MKYLDFLSTPEILKLVTVKVFSDGILHGYIVYEDIENIIIAYLDDFHIGGYGILPKKHIQDISSIDLDSWYHDNVIDVSSILVFPLHFPRGELVSVECIDGNILIGMIVHGENNLLLLEIGNDKHRINFDMVRIIRYGTTELKLKEKCLKEGINTQIIWKSKSNIEIGNFISIIYNFQENISRTGFIIGNNNEFIEVALEIEGRYNPTIIIKKTAIKDLQIAESSRYLDVLKQIFYPYCQNSIISTSIDHMLDQLITKSMIEVDYIADCEQKSIYGIITELDKEKLSIQEISLKGEIMKQGININPDNIITLSYGGEYLETIGKMSREKVK